jgi:hypothetical protein
MFYFAPSNLPLNWLAAGLIRIRKSTLWKANGCVAPSRQPLGRTLPAGRGAEKWCAQKQLIYRADFLSPWLRSQKSCTVLRELHQRDKKLRALATLARMARMALKRDTTCGHEARERRFPAELPRSIGYDSD